MFAKANRRRNIIHSFNISRAKVKVKRAVIASLPKTASRTNSRQLPEQLGRRLQSFLSLRGSLEEATEAISNFLCPPVYAADKGSDPVAYWRFDEGGGPTAYDDAGTNDGTLQAGDDTGSNDTAGEMWSTAGKFGSALECDGTNDYVLLSSPIIYDTLTYSAWIKTTQTLGTYFIPIIDGSYGSYSEPMHGGIAIANTAGTARMYAGYIDGAYRSVTGSTAVNDGQWHHIVGTSDEVNGIKIFVEGALRSSQ